MVPLATGGLTPSSPLSGPISVPAPVPHGNIAPAMGMPVGMAPGNISIPPVMSGPGGVPAGGTPPSSGKFYGNQQMMMGGPPHYTPPYISGSPYAGAPPVPYSNPMPYSSAPLVSAPPKKRLEIRDKEGNVVELPQKTPKAVAIAPVAPMDTAAAVSPAEVVTAPTPAGEAAVVSPSLAPSASTPLELAVPAPAPASEPVTAPEVAVASVASAEVKQEVVEEEEEAWEKEDVNVIVASGQTATKNNAAAAAVVAGVSAPPGLELVGPASSSASALSAASAGIANILSSAPGVITITPSSGQKNKNKMLKSKLAEADSKGSHGDLLDYFSNSSDSSTPGLVTVSVTATATGLTDRTATPPMPAPIPTPAVNHTLPRAPVNFKSGNRTSPSVSGGSLSVSASTTPSIPTSPSPSLPPGIAGLPGAGDDESVTADNWEASAVSAATNLAAAGVAANVPSAAPPVAPVAPVVPVTPTPVPSRRELRPSGNGLNKIASSRGSPAIVPVKPLVKLSYSKDEMLTVFGVMSSQGLLDAPTAGIAEKYGFQIEVLYDTPAGGGRPLPSPSHGGGGMSRQNSMDHNRSSSSGGGGMSNQPSSSSGFNKSGYSGDSAWKRQDASVTAQQQSMQNVSTNQQGRQQGGRGGRRSAGPAPRKIITDPVEQLKRDVKAILNKITPQTFSKLSQQLCDINLSTAEMLDTLIHEIFEKAVDEPKFCQIYAETCHRIEEAQKSKLPAFIQIVHDRDSKTYASIRDLDMEGVNAAGPYRDESDCMAAAASVTPPVMVPLDCVSNNIELHKLIISNQILHKLFRNTDTEAFYVSFCPASEISHLLGEKAFMDPDNARADAVKMNTLKRKILMVCQQEYTNATTQEGYYLKFPLAEEKFREDVAAGIIVKGADNYEYETRESDLEMLRIKTKNRRMGNIRFVGELFKMKLVPARVMYDCISEILLTRDAEGEFTEWKAAPDDADIELLCHLLRTVGKMLDESNKSGCEGQMDNFFQRLLQLSTDKAISSRMRFALIELIELRLSKWVERREVEKPQTIEEIHAAAAAEEDFKAGGGSGKMTSNPNLRFTASGKQLQGGGDFRSQGKNVGGPGFSPGMKKNPNSTQNNRLGTQPRSIMKNPDSSSNQPPGTTTSSISSILDRYKNSSRKSGKSSGASGAANTNTGNSNNKDRNVNTIASSTPSPDVEQRQQDTSSSAAVTATGPVCFLDYDVEDLKGTVTSIIRDYLKEKDAAHAMSRIEEEANAHPPNIFGVQFILTFIEFSMDCKVSEQAFLLSWLTQPDTLLTKLFVQGEGDMAAALSQSDTIQFMPDSMSDFKNAPEWIGSILAHLVQVKALDLKAALAMSDKCLLNYLEDEFSDSATGNSCYARLKTAIAKQ